MKIKKAVAACGRCSHRDKLPLPVLYWASSMRNGILFCHNLATETTRGTETWHLRCVRDGHMGALYSRLRTHDPPFDPTLALDIPPGPGGWAGAYVQVARAAGVLFTCLHSVRANRLVVNRMAAEAGRPGTLRITPVRCGRNCGRTICPRHLRRIHLPTKCLGVRLQGGGVHCD